MQRVVGPRKGRRAEPRPGAVADRMVDGTAAMNRDRTVTWSARS